VAYDWVSIGIAHAEKVSIMLAMENMTDIERRIIARRLEGHHAIFERIWQLSRIRFSKKLKTAGVYFNKKGECVDFIINPDFWASLDDVTKDFVFCHECLHISLNHGHRSLGGERKLHKIRNIAQDLVINHGLVNYYGFSRSKIDPDNRYCWIDKFFLPHDKVHDEECFEFYFNRLRQMAQDNPDQFQNGSDNSETVDDHESSPEDLDLDPDEYSDDFDDVIDYLNDKMSDEEKYDMKDFIEENQEPDQYFDDNTGSSSTKTTDHKAGNQAGKGWTFAQPLPYKEPVKFEKIVTSWAKKTIKEKEIDYDQFVFRNRRYARVLRDRKLPTEHEMEVLNRDNDRTVAWFFQDTSHSCKGWRDRFFNIAERMPKDIFDMRLFCFDHEIHDTTLESRELKGFGGTSFTIIEGRIQRALKDREIPKYPDAVFVITDGIGNDVHPAKPDNWHVMLTPGGRKSNFKGVTNFYDLKDYI
jgi:hypothetical protein